MLSWASGSNPWGPERDDQFMRPTHYDGMLEVVGVTGVVHMGQIQSGLRSAMRIAQGGHVSIFLQSIVAVTAHTAKLYRFCLVCVCLCVCVCLSVRLSVRARVSVHSFLPPPCLPIPPPAAAAVCAIQP